MTLKNFIKSGSLITILVFASCDSMLNVEPKGRYLSNSYMVSESQVFSVLMAAYDPLQWSYVDGRWVSVVMLGEIWSDNANTGGDQTDADQPGWQDIDNLKASPLSPDVQAFWKKYYFGINKANQVLNNAKISSSIVQTYQAEAKFLRAFYHFELFRTFGPVPVVTSEPPIADRSFKRNTLTEVFTRITTDLEEAIPLLPVSYSSEFAGRITQGAAYALLGKAYLYWADWKNDNEALFDKAAQNLYKVIESGKYQLLDDYKQLFAFGAANTSESVFEIQYTNQVAGDWNVPYNIINGNMIVQLCGIRGICSTHPLYQEGWGFMLITANLYNSYLPDDLVRRESSIISGTSLALGGCPVNATAQNPVDFEGYWQKKYANFKSYTQPAGGEPNVLKDPNQPYIRYADVLLMYAEALVRGTGSETDAMTYIDMVRERAKGPGNNAGSFRTASTLMTDEGWSLLEVIWYERRAELAGEGDRWFDLVRSGRAKSDIFGPGNPRTDNFTQDDRFLPIPQIDLDIMSGSLTPYPDEALFQ